MEKSLGYLKQLNMEIFKLGDKYIGKVLDSQTNSYIIYQIKFKFQEIVEHEKIIEYCKLLIQRDELIAKKHGNELELIQDPKTIFNEPPKPTNVSRTSENLSTSFEPPKPTNVPSTPQNSSSTNYLIDSDFFANMHKMMASGDRVINIKIEEHKFKHVDGQMVLKQEATREFNIKPKEVAIKEIEAEKEKSINELVERTRADQLKHPKDINLSIAKLHEDSVFRVQQMKETTETMRVQMENQIKQFAINLNKEIEVMKINTKLELEKAKMSNTMELQRAMMEIESKLERMSYFIKS